MKRGELVNLGLSSTPEKYWYYWGNFTNHEAVQ